MSWEGHAVTIAPSLLEETYMRLRSCGQRRRECQLFWVASLDDPSRIIRVVHPVHTATMASVEIDAAWLNEFFLELADKGECIRAQVHSHPGAAFHSSTDDGWPAVRAPGFLSLVLPDFATRTADLEDAYLAEQDAHCNWRRVELEERIRVESALAA